MARLSDLPDDIIRFIVSFLSAKSAALTRLQSKNLLKLITIELDLAFDQSKKNNGKTFQEFVAGISKLLASDRIRKFSLKLQNLDKSQFILVNDCLSNVLKRGIMDLELDINVKEEDEYSLPDEVFTCKTIEKLKLGSGFVIKMIPRKALLPALKTLILDTVRFDDLGGECVFQELLSVCHVIEELVVNGFNWEHWKWSRSVSSQTLKRLTMKRGDWNFDNWSKSDTMSFNTPNVTYLEYSDILLYEYPTVNLNSLVEAKLELTLRYFGTDYNLMNLIKGIKNVQTLRLEAVDTMRELFYDFSEQVPVFENLIHISALTDGEVFCCHGLRVLVEKSPKLESLTIKGDLHYFKDDENCESVCECLRDYSFLLTCPIKVLKITKFGGYYGELVHLEHVLEKLLHLEVLELDVQARDDEKVEILTNLLLVPRGSSKCKFLVQFS